MYVKEKELWGRIDGSTTKTKESTENTNLAQWETNDARIICWILSSVDTQVVCKVFKD